MSRTFFDCFVGALWNSPGMTKHDFREIIKAVKATVDPNLETARIEGNTPDFLAGWWANEQQHTKR